MTLLQLSTSRLQSSVRRAWEGVRFGYWHRCRGPVPCIKQAIFWVGLPLRVSEQHVLISGCDAPCHLQVGQMSLTHENLGLNKGPLPLSITIQVPSIMLSRYHLMQLEAISHRPSGQPQQALLTQHLHGVLRYHLQCHRRALHLLCPLCKEADLWSTQLVGMCLRQCHRLCSCSVKYTGEELMLSTRD